MTEFDKPQSESENENESSAKSPWGFLAGLVFGSLAGASAMMMLAPQSGKRTRTKLQHKTIQLRDQASEVVEDAVDRTRAIAHQVKVDVRKDAKNLKHRGQEVLDEQKANVSAAVEAGKEAIQG